MIDKWDMQVALKCFNSDFLERKIQGLKAIQDLIKKTKDYQVSMQNSDIKFLTIQIMVEWLNENRIFETLYVNSSNSHLVQRSAEFFKFMLEEKLVTLNHIGMIWAGVNKGETEHKLAIYKLLKDAYASLDKE
jgi:ubiquitin carboxyl-terminal hydrolase 34